jgi:hypothetical protein
MAGFNSTIANNVNFQLGTHEFGPFLIDNDVKTIKIAFTRDQWTNTNARLDVVVEVSYENEPFREMMGFTAFGGPPFPAPKPNVVSQSVTFTEGRTQRRVQGRYSVSGARFRSTVTIAAVV